MTTSRPNARQAVALLLTLLPVTTLAGDEKVDLQTIHRIKDDAFHDSKVMDHLFFLTDVNGPRLTNSPGQRAAAEWAVTTLKSWGIDNAHQETWGKFGRSWSLTRFTMSLKAPAYAPLAGVPLAWSSGTNGSVSGEAVFAPLFTAQELERRDDRDPGKLAARIRTYTAENKGKLKGKFVLLSEPREMLPPTEVASHRLDEKDLGDLHQAPEPYVEPPIRWPITSLPDDPKKREQLIATMPFAVGSDLAARLRHMRDGLNAFFKEEGVTAVLSGDSRGAGAILFAEAGGSFE